MTLMKVGKVDERIGAWFPVDMMMAEGFTGDEATRLAFELEARRAQAQADARAELDDIARVFRHDILPSLDNMRPLIGPGMPIKVRRTFERLEAALAVLGDA
jgi:hypothetical protein